MAGVDDGEFYLASEADAEIARLKEALEVATKCCWCGAPLHTTCTGHCDDDE